MECCRERKEWHLLTQEERCLFVDAMVVASTQQPYKNCYDNLVNFHGKYFYKGLHGGPTTFFLPFHRWYILQLENLLRRVNCKVTMPYWDWSAEAETWKDSIVWNTKCGFGGDGNPNKSYRISGLFGVLKWKPPGIPAVTRSFNGFFPNTKRVCAIQQYGASQYAQWHRAVELTLHNPVHCSIGGDMIKGTMCTDMAANDPIFFLHHVFIDHLWYDWQQKGREYLEHKAYAKDTTFMPIAHETSPSQVYDLFKQPGCIKICPQTPTCLLNVPNANPLRMELLEDEYN